MLTCMTGRIVVPSTEIEKFRRNCFGENIIHSLFYLRCLLVIPLELFGDKELELMRERPGLDIKM